MTAVAAKDRSTRPIILSVPRRAVPPALSGAGLALWTAMAIRARGGDVGPFGLAGGVGPVGWTALALFTAGFVAELARDRPRSPLLAIQLVGAVIALDGFSTLVEGSVANPTAWIHVGFVDYILRHGATYRHFDARFSWPGSFAFAAVMTTTAGAKSAATFTAWCAPVIDALCLLPLHVLARSLAPSARVGWAAMWVFVLGNWIGQDYFSPQALAFLVSLCLLAIVLATSQTVPKVGRVSLGLLRQRLTSQRQPMLLPTTKDRAVVVSAIVAMAAAITVAHQLTPYALVVALAVLVVCGRCAWRSLPVVVLVIAVAWLSLGAQDYWANHLSALSGGVGSVSASLSQNLTSRTRGAHDHLLVIYARMALSIVLALAALIGSGLRRWRKGRGWLLELLVVAPFLLLLLQSYGGELLLRADLFALPFVAILAASGVALLPFGRILKALAACAVATSLGVVLVIARYGNEPFVRTSAAEIDAVNAAYRMAAPGARLAVMSQNLPWRARDIERVQTVSYERICGPIIDAHCVNEVAADLVIVTAGQRQYAALVQGIDGRRWATVLADVLPTAGYRVVFENRDATIFARRGVSVPITGPTTYLDRGQIRAVL